MDARLQRQFEGSLARSATIRMRRKIARASGVVALAACVGLVGFFARPKPAPAPLAFGLEGTVVDTSGQQTMTLVDGTRLEIGANTHADFRVARPELVRIALDHGEMDFDVTHLDGRGFEVVCGARTVKVIGTHFHVLSDGPRFSVSVERGRVRVDGPDGAIELGAGETFARGFDPPPIDSVAPVASSAPVPIVPAPKIESASNVFSRAQSARLAGRTAEAARAYDDLRQHHRTDARAGLAAFELGRIRLDDLGDPAGAAEAFQDAIALSPSASYREDAEARRVEALDAVHDRACTNARDAYLARYPQGVFRASVSKRCAPLPSP